ncbi:hypothetical protein BD413DRAFT_613204 [Trametes elegans]|nr:hypothetical protein BD413DRAFT_613204 [Trametes elegans]
MLLFRAVFIFTAATFAFVGTNAPVASAFILPLTRYMLDKVPDDGEAPAGDVASGDGAPADASDAASVSSDVPVAAGTPPVANSEGPKESPTTLLNNLASSSTLVHRPASAAVDVFVQSSAPAAVQSSASTSQDLAQTNGAVSMVVGSHAIMAGSVIATVFLAL